MTAGTVYVHNYNVNQVLHFEVDGNDVGRIDSWKRQDGTPAPYSPGSIAVPRIYPDGDPSVAGFKPGENPIQIVWPSFNSKSAVTLPSLNDLPINQDLVLVLTKGTLILIDASTGMVRQVADGSLP
ncbi:hypothetical protein [Glycomyces xiaoerkulensis]|uniref:hypothetical protein n=1 Tax=Glycomyces xiaoerkulensis TaxID=2038139 RepID=UPI000C25EF11|nr:hypothetical protein [Glycomyces xiaoerkulensis]